jgi:hypothetical protein
LKAFVDEFENIFGAPTNRRELDSDALERVKVSSCQTQIDCLKQFGASDFCNGLVRLVNPVLYRSIVELVLAKYPMFSKSNIVPVLLGAFGQVDMIGVNDGVFLRFQLFQNRILLMEEDVALGQRDGADVVLRQNLLASDPEDFDLLDDDGHSVFEQLSAKLGPLNGDEIFSLTPESTEVGIIADDIGIEKVSFIEHLESIELHPKLVTL